MITKLALVTAAAILAVFAIACSDDDDGGTPTNTPPPAVTPTPDDGQSDPDPTPTETTPDVTAPAIIDRIRAAVRTNDIATLESLVRFADVPCVIDIQGLGGPPECEPGETEGTLVSVVQGSACEGFWVREGRPIFGNINIGGFGITDPVYGVFSVENAPLAPGWPDAEYAVVLARSGPADESLAFTLLADETDIVGYVAACGESPEQFVEVQRLGEPLFEE